MKHILWMALAFQEYNVYCYKDSIEDYVFIGRFKNADKAAEYIGDKDCYMEEAEKEDTE